MSHLAFRWLLLALSTGEGDFERWIHAQAVEENLTVTSTNTFLGADGVRIPYARLVTPGGTAVVVEAAGARWVLGPYTDGTEPLPDRLGIQYPFHPSIPQVKRHLVLFDFRGGMPVVTVDRYETPTGSVDLDYARLQRLNSGQQPIALLPVLPDADETVKLVLRAGTATGEVVAHRSKLWLRSAGQATWRMSWTEGAVRASEQWLQIDLPTLPNNPGPFGEPLVITLTSEGQRDSRSFTLIRFAEPGRWRSATPWVRKLEGGRIWKQPTP
jgi:hypothetical protein